jgi:hypothetical protein
VKAELARIERDHPGWHCWEGVGVLLYARLPRSSPPVVVSATTPAELEARIREHEARQR